MLMTPSEFAERAVGLPWVRWRSDWGACDCFGLVVLYYREVLGIDLGSVPQTDVAGGFFAQAERWRECEPEPGATVWMAWRDGSPTHVGVLIDAAHVMHAEGSPETGGSVRVNRLDVLRKLYGETRFVRFVPC